MRQAQLIELQWEREQQTLTRLPQKFSQLSILKLIIKIIKTELIPSKLIIFLNSRLFLCFLAYSSIHSHSDAHCFMKMLDGTLTETLYHWPEKASKKRPMEQFAANDYHENQVAYICGECWLPEKGYIANQACTI